MRKIEYDFLTFTSFPSSGKLISDETEDWVRWPGIPHLFVKPGSRIKVTLNAKREGTTPTYRPSHFTLMGYNEKGMMRHLFWPFIRLPETSFNWKNFSREETIPADIVMIGGQCAGGVGTTWFDDLKIYMDDKLIYANDFSNWNPYIGAGAGAVATAIPAWLVTKNPLTTLGVSVLVGAPLGGLVGYLTAKP